MKKKKERKKKQTIPDSRSSRVNVSRCMSFREKMHRCHPTEYRQSPYVRESRLRNPGNFCLRNQESWLWRILLTTETRNPCSNDKKSGIQSLESGIRNPYKDLNPESKFHWHRLESSTWNSESTAWNPESKTVLDSLTWGGAGSF